VVFAVGIRPNIALAQSAGLRCNRGILVNDTMQTFDPSIYAVVNVLNIVIKPLDWWSHFGGKHLFVQPIWLNMVA
jgi:NADPH-dependent 2,4-dienoyl-CoA reductase/sulfur reductase-like enzyme